MAVDLSSYLTVAERIAEFRAKHPEGCLRPLDPDEPFKVVTVGDKMFVTYAAAAFRTPDDPCPGVGLAWEPFPGRTSFTRDSELMNAETSAWGRAIVAVLASDTTKGIATREEVQNRQEGSQGHSGASPQRLTGPPIHKAAEMVKSTEKAKSAETPDIATLIKNATEAKTLDELREVYLATGNSGFLQTEVVIPSSGEKFTMKEYLEMRSDALGSPKSAQPGTGKPEGSGNAARKVSGK